MDVTELQVVIEGVYQFYLDHGCPCRFPRFRRLVSFNFTDYSISPTACLESHLFLEVALRGPNASFVPVAEPEESPDGSSRKFQCKVCKSVALEHYADFSISMWHEYLLFQTVLAEDLGADVVAPLPLVNGFFGFQKRDWSVLNADFRKSCSASEFVSYMTMLRPLPPDA